MTKDRVAAQSHLPTAFMCLSPGPIERGLEPPTHTISLKNVVDQDASAIPSPERATQFQRFLVYCDFIQDRIVGGIRTGLLISVPNPGMAVRHHATSYSQDHPIPLYYAVKDMMFRSFTFQVGDDNGDPIDFDWGSTSLELHFKRRRGVKRSWNGT